jgi:hypothetical protein
MHRKHFREFAVETTTLYARQTISPVAVTWIWLEWVWKAVVEVTLGRRRSRRGGS